MQNIKKYFMTLALLLTAVTGAWAQSSLKVVEFDVPAAWQNDNSLVTAGDLPGFKAVTLAEAQAWTGAPATDNAVLVYAFNGDNVCVVPFKDGTALQEVETTYAKNVVFASKSKMKFYYTTEVTEWSLTPDADKKVWTLAKMPANNIELQVEYYAESNLFLGKEALADKANIAVTAGELGVQFGDDGKSANTITEGTAMTVTYNGTKKILGMKVAKVDLSKAYLKWDADQKKLVATDIPAEVTTVKDVDGNAIWQAGTYVVEGDVTISGQIALSGNVDLIIKDGAKLTAKQIYGSSSNHNLSIYGQANKTGQLVVNSSNDEDAIAGITTLEVHSAKVTATSSSGGCSGFYEISTFNVYGGSVDGENTGSDGYGISLKKNGSMNIYGGDVKAVGKGDYHGIGGGSSSTVTVYGGKLWAGCADKKAIDFGNVTLTKDTGYTSGKIEYSSDKSTWSETKDTSAKYVRVGY